VHRWPDIRRSRTREARRLFLDVLVVIAKSPLGMRGVVGVGSAQIQELHQHYEAMRNGLGLA